MEHPRTAPEGYHSNFAALLDLLRFGFGIWKPPTMAVLLFHVERSTAYGKPTDQHAQAQALHGIHSFGRWVRGPAGVANGTLNRENTALIDAGILTKIKRSTPKGGHAASEFRVNWPAIRDAIAAWKAAAPFSQAGRSPSPTLGVPFSHAGRSPSPTLGDTVVNSGFSSLVNQSDRPTDSAAEVLSALEAALQAPLRPNATEPGRLLAIAQRLSIPTRALCLWIQEFATAKRAANYPITGPGLMLKAASVELIPWAKSHAELIHQARQDTITAWAPPAPPAPWPTPTFQKCPQCGEESMLDGTCHSEECIHAREAKTTDRNAAEPRRRRRTVARR